MFRLHIVHLYIEDGFNDILSQPPKFFEKLKIEIRNCVFPVAVYIALDILSDKRASFFIREHQER